MTDKKQVPLCSTCLTSEVKVDAWAMWDEESQEWVLQSTYDANAYCDTCDGECSIEWQYLEE